MITVLLVYTGIASILIVVIVNVADKQLFSGLDMHYFKVFINLYVVPWMLGTIAMIFILVNAGSGDAKGSMYLIISNMYIIVILTLIIMPKMFEDQIIGVFVSLATIQILTFINSLSFYKTNRWTKNYFA